ncbi:MAG: Arm DNA-binding domain-containing protein [Deltaproteobacteria bacterium]|jgi:hypothetical protein|nr:Arm DNA-binding domain-containing protein [Deltaproteobacteria bacterium]
MGLTDKFVKGIKLIDKAQTYFDINGLCLEVTPTGLKSWKLKYFAAGEDTRVTLGPWPEVTLRQARVLAETQRQELEKPPDPEKSLFQTLADDWAERFLGKYVPKGTGF